MTEYSERLSANLKLHLDELRAREAAAASEKWLPYADAIHLAGQARFGAHWIGAPTFPERAVARVGALHPDWARDQLRDVERDAQIAEVDRWLRIHGLIEYHSGQTVRENRLREKIALETVDLEPNAKVRRIDVEASPHKADGLAEFEHRDERQSRTERSSGARRTHSPTAADEEAFKDFGADLANRGERLTVTLIDSWAEKHGLNRNHPRAWQGKFFPETARGRGRPPRGATE